MKPETKVLLSPAHSGDRPVIHEALVAAREARAASVNVEGVSVFLKIDGRVLFAPIPAESAQLFIGMLSAFQAGHPKQATVHVMPDEVAAHVEAAGRELAKVFAAMRRTKGAANG